MNDFGQIPSVAIILVNWNGLDYTLACIDSLKAVTYTNFQVIVVDNGSQEEQVATLRSLASIHLIENEENLGFTGGNNVGIEYALAQGFDQIMLLNNDTEVAPNFLEHLVPIAESQKVGAVQPKIFQINSKVIWSLGGRFNSVFGKPRTIGAGQKDELKWQKGNITADWLTGCCLLARASVFKEVGLLDNNYFALCEDVDWSLRGRNRGYELRVVNESIIYHHESASDKSKVKTTEGYRSPFRQYLNVRNHLYLVRKFVPWYFKPVAFSYYLLRAISFAVYYALRRRPKKLKMTVKGLIDGLSRVGFDK